jgi:pimeloyl-ACP methyl ester carboxylesterase
MNSRLIERVVTSRRTQIVGTVLVALCVGCAPDKPLGPSAAANGAPSFMQVCDPALGCTDGSLNRSDSYVIGDIVAVTTATYSSASSFVDPQTGQTVYSVTVNSTPRHLHVEAGYDTNRQPVINTKFTDGADPQSDPIPQITAMSTRTNITTERNIYGTALVDETTPDLPDPTPMNLLGNLQNANVTAGAILNVNGTISQLRLAPAQIRSIEDTVKRVNPAALVVVDQPSPGLLRITQTMSARPSESPSVNVNASGPPAGVGNAHPGTARNSRVYELRGGKWLLAEMRTANDDSANGSSRHLEHVMAVHISSWSINSVRDAERQAARPTAEVVPIADASVSSTSSGVRFAPTNPSSVVCLPGTTGPNCTPAGGGGGGGTPPDVGADLGCAANVVGAVHPDGANLILQHGMLSSASTWCQIEPYFRSRFRVGFEIRHSLDAHAAIDNQRNDLKSRVLSENNGRGQFIIVGHSVGGLIGRRLAQQGGPAGGVYPGSTTPLIRGVVTISSPNKGAPIAGVAIQAAQELFGALTSYGCEYVRHTGCYFLDSPFAGQINYLLTELSLNTAYPVLYDIRPGSTFLNSMNAVPEGFLRAGVQNYSWDKWTFYRLIGDWNGAGGGGRATVRRVDKSYHRALDCAVIGGLTGFFYAPAWQVAGLCARVAAGLEGVDLLWKYLSVPGESGDCVVPGHSQLYPNVSSVNQFGVLDADSHVGVLKSGSTSVPVIARAITQTFSLPLP